MDIPKDITDPRIKIPYVYPRSVTIRSYNPHLKGHRWQIKKAADLLLSARRPMVYSGGGVILGNASGQLIELVRRLGFPSPAP